jgi:hypothetical protein
MLLLFSCPPFLAVVTNYEGLDPLKASVSSEDGGCVVTWVRPL